jgi:isopenicillin N synthase-like dioxygenase
LENIHSHTDWTLATLVPVSRVVGLELWNLSQQTWVRPEEIARQHSESQFDMHGNNKNADWNSGYVIIMGGKWLEILTKGNVQAGVHRVVSTNECTLLFTTKKLYSRGDATTAWCNEWQCV